MLQSLHHSQKSKNMKKHLIFFTLFFTLLGIYTTSFAQCDVEALNERALRTLPKGFTFVKSYKVDGKGGIRKTIEYTCVFSKDTQYIIRMASRDGGVQGVLVTLYDSQRNELATSHVNNKFFPGWTYNCKATGIYYISFSFKDSQSYCAGAVMGFKR